MKAEVSIPEELFREAERLAKRLLITRSRLYARALIEFLARHDDDRVRAAMDESIEEVGSETNGFSRAAADRALRRAEG